mmetsp:Transcript_31699/g.44173  ORF Transcript_31699/g.44173 Transcript_31699/m.44173 type:complete len:326 (+) Transcript_31699:651-1628(+)
MTEKDRVTLPHVEDTEILDGGIEGTTELNSSFESSLSASVETESHDSSLSSKLPTTAIIPDCGACAVGEVVACAGSIVGAILLPEPSGAGDGPFREATVPRMNALPSVVKHALSVVDTIPQMYRTWPFCHDIGTLISARYVCMVAILGVSSFPSSRISLLVPDEEKEEGRTAAGVARNSTAASELSAPTFISVKRTINSSSVVDITSKNNASSASAVGMAATPDIGMVLSPPTLLCSYRPKMSAAYRLIWQCGSGVGQEVLEREGMPRRSAIIEANVGEIFKPQLQQPAYPCVRIARTTPLSGEYIGAPLSPAHVKLGSAAWSWY